MAEPGARQHTSKGRDRRAQLLDHAARRFAERGYDQTSVADVCASLGVGKGVFYWYFPDGKDRLLLEILRDAQHDLRRRQQQAIAGEDDPLRRIELGIVASIRWLHEHRHLATLTDFAATDERFAADVRRGRDVHVADLVRHVKEGIVAGRIADADPDVLAHAVLGVGDRLARTYLIDRGEDPDEVAAMAVAFCLGGLAAGTATDTSAPARPAATQRHRVSDGPPTPAP